MRFVEIVAYAESKPRCLDVQNRHKSNVDGKKVQIYDCSQRDNQRWALQSDSSIRIMKEGKKFCLSYLGGVVKMSSCSVHKSKWRHDEATGQIRMVENTEDDMGHC